MDYLWLKALHVVAIIVWIGGMFGTALAARTLPGGATPERRSAIAALRRWDQRVTAPAMGLAWLLGLTMAVMGGWIWQTWFLLKFAIVFLLSGLHGMQGGALRRMESDGTPAVAPVLQRSPAILIGATTAIAVLVIVKPFQ